MAFDRVIGQETPRERLMDALKQGRLAHAYLLHGPPGTGAETLAVELAKAVNCLEGDGEPCQVCRSCRKIAALQHPDVHVYPPASSSKTTRGTDTGDNDEDEPEDRSVRMDARTERRITLTGRLAEDPYTPLDLNKNDFISIDDIRELRQEASAKPYEGRRKVTIVVSADRMNIPASNALLKTLEEPPGALLLLLTTHRPHQLLPTILSRCQPVHLARLEEAEIRETLVTRFGTPPPKAALAARQADGSLSLAILRSAPEGERLYEKAAAFLESVHADNALGLFDAVEQLAAAHKEQPVVERLIDIMLRYYRDLFLLIVDPSITDIIHTDREAWLRQTAARLAPEQVETGIRALEAAKRDIARNAHLQLALTVLALRLRSLPAKTVQTVR